jgi:hypothetical protein
MFAVAPAPTTRVHDPSGVGTHGEALASAGQSPFGLRGSAYALRLILWLLRYAAERPTRLYELPTSDARSPAG